jgi:hypothetical protein
MKRLALLILIAALSLAFFALGLHQHPTLDTFHAGDETFDVWYAQASLAGHHRLFHHFLAVTTLFPGLRENGRKPSFQA